MDDSVDEVIAVEAPAGARHVLVLDRPALVDVARAWSPVNVWCDDLRDLARLDPTLVVNPFTAPEGLVPDQVWMGLPTSLDALDETLSVLHALAVRHGVEDLHVIAGGRTRHMNRSMNEVGARWFDEVHASRGWGRARALHFEHPRERPARGGDWPRHNTVGEAGPEIVAHGAAFHTAGLDAGTALLLAHLDRIVEGLPAGATVHDLGCGNGVIATTLARRLGDRAAVSASDVSWAAVDSTRMTAAANGVDVDVTQRDGFEGLPDACLDLVVTNPPFHRGTAKESGPTLVMLADAGRVLRPGGHLWCVYNSHLPWGEHLDQTVGPTRQIARNRAYTVTMTTKR